MTSRLFPQGWEQGDNRVSVDGRVGLGGLRELLPGLGGECGEGRTEVSTVGQCVRLAPRQGTEVGSCRRYTPGRPALGWGGGEAGEKLGGVSVSAG